MEEYCTACSPAVNVEVPPLCKATANVEFATIWCVVTRWREISKCCRLRQSKARNRRIVNSFDCGCVCNSRVTASWEVFVPELEVVTITPVIISYIIERERCLDSLSCRGITINSQPLTLVIIIGLRVLLPLNSRIYMQDYKDKVQSFYLVISDIY